jgi:hypothetical protein
MLSQVIWFVAGAKEKTSACAASKSREGLRLSGEAGLQVGADTLDDGFGRSFADELLQDRAIAADQDIRWQSIHSELVLEAAVGIEALRPNHIVAGDEGVPDGLVIVLADAYDHEVGASVDGLKTLEVR